MPKPIALPIRKDKLFCAKNLFVKSVILFCLLKWLNIPARVEEFETNALSLTKFI